MKLLMLGSAGYIKDWAKSNLSRFVGEGFKICAINNAWAVAPGLIDIWVRAEDYYVMPTNKIPDKKYNWYEIVKTKTVPLSAGQGKEGGTILLNAIYHFMNLCFENKDTLWLSLAGCDLIYNGKDDWFYGKGHADPLVFGKKFLVYELQKIKEIAEYFGYTIVNVGGREETLLPFARH